MVATTDPLASSQRNRWKQNRMSDNRSETFMRNDDRMHYHYFTIEQRNVLTQLMRARMAEPGMESALERLHTAEFGVCESCGADIPFVQLKTNPQLRRCVRCFGRE
jgi:RNA polymerase-binding transcription factor DksA